MTRHLTLAAVLFAAAVAVPAFAQTPAAPVSPSTPSAAPLTTEQKAVKTADWEKRRAAWEKRNAEKFAKADANADGALSKEEFLADVTARATERFTETDTNKDGKVSKEEMNAAREKMRAEAQARREAKGHKTGHN